MYGADGNLRHPLSTRRRTPFKRALLLGMECGLQRSGAATVFGWRTQAAGAIILAYHSVPTAELAPWIDPANELDPDVFAEQMAFLARHRTVLGMGELISMLESGRTPERGTVVITFDDGYLDVLDVCAPLLARYSFPATIYVPTGCISRNEPPWIDVLYDAFTWRTRHEVHVPDADLPPTILDTHDNTICVYRHLASRLIVADLSRRQRVLEAVEGQLRPARRPPRLTMTWDDMRRLRDRFPLIEIGAHSVDHVDLTTCGPEELHRQTAGAASDFTRELGSAPLHFSCPYGRWTPEVGRRLGECGYRSVVADGGHTLIQAGSDRLCLGRVSVAPSMTLFRYFTSGAYPRMSKLLFGRA